MDECPQLFEVVETLRPSGSRRTDGREEAIEFGSHRFAEEIVLGAVTLTDGAVAEPEFRAECSQRDSLVAQFGEPLEGGVEDFMILNDFGSSALSHAPHSFGIGSRVVPSGRHRIC